MRLTKFGHACLFLEKDDRTIIIDPGCFTELPQTIPNNVAAVVITEEHVDHFDQKNLEAILKTNPEATVLTTQAVKNALSETEYQVTAISGTKQVEIGGFTLHFNETDHAAVYKASPCKSLALQVDDSLYYPSDSYLPTKNPVQILALPLSGPWFKVSEAIDFANQIDCQKILVTHNALNSESGDTVAISHTKNNLLSDTEIVSLKPGSSIEA